MTTHKNSESWCERSGQKPPKNPEHKQCLGEAYPSGPFNLGLSRAQEKEIELLDPEEPLHRPPARFPTLTLPRPPHLRD